MNLRSPTLSGALYFVCGVLLCAALLAHAALGVPFEKLFRGPNAIAEMHPFTGALSVVGTFMWAAGAAICLFSAAVLRARGASGPLSGFLIASGGLTLWLLFDDQFQIHEEIADDRLGVDQRFFFIAYLGLIAWGVYHFRTCIFDSPYPLLVASLAFLGLSVAIDVFHSVVPALDGDAGFFLEDGFKLLGIAGWLGYYAQTCFGALGITATMEGVAAPLR